MKTIALTLFAAALGLAQNQSPTQKQTQADAATNAARAPRGAPKAAATAPKKKAAPATPQKTDAQPQTQSIPPGAKQVEPNLYRFTDSNGKTWNYRQTPFGISKWEETSAPSSHLAPQSSPTPVQVKSDPVAVTDLGDSYRFERKTPFGASTWVRKKSDLTDEDKVIVGSQQAPSNPSGSTVDSKPAGNQ